MKNAARLLGFAFANADLLLEVEKDGAVVFATGAVTEFSRLPTLTGVNVSALFEGTGAIKLLARLGALPAGGRAGPLKLKLADGRDVQASLCRLPQNGERVSCTLSWPGPFKQPKPGALDAATGLEDFESFLDAVGETAGTNATLALIDVPELAKPEHAREHGEGLLGAIARAVKSVGGRAAGRLGETSFGVLGPAGTSKLNLAQIVRKKLSDGHHAVPEISEALVSLSGKGLTDEQRMLSLRYCVSRFASGQHGGKPGDDLGDVFRNMVAETQARAEALTETVAKSAFHFVYQPIVNLKTGVLAHCEALVRFTSGAGAGETVRFAEALGISEPFDLAVAAKVIREVEHSPEARVAFNLSGRTLGDPMTFGLISGLLAQKRGLKSQLLVEITETAEITDLAAANAAVQSLRGMGFHVGIDDFGAGAASLQYLHAMLVDFVKFDGALIAKLGASQREDRLLSGIVALCTELGVETIAECIESDAQMRRARDMGFTLGQGHYFGKGAPEIAVSKSEQRVGKRKGVQVSWG